MIWALVCLLGACASSSANDSRRENAEFRNTVVILMPEQVFYASEDEFSDPHLLNNADKGIVAGSTLLLGPVGVGLGLGLALVDGIVSNDMEERLQEDLQPLRDTYDLPQLAQTLTVAMEKHAVTRDRRVVLLPFDPYSEQALFSAVPSADDLMVMKPVLVLSRDCRQLQLVVTAAIQRGSSKQFITQTVFSERIKPLYIDEVLAYWRADSGAAVDRFVAEAIAALAFSPGAGR